MTTRKLSLGLLFLLFAGGIAAAQQTHGRAVPSQVWSKAMIEKAETIPIQDGGRIKPLLTYARFKLLGLNGRTSAKLRDGRKLTATEWLLDCIFAPETARTYPVLLVRNDEVLDGLGLSHEGRKKSDRYSYAEIAPAFDKLIKLYDQYVEIDPKRRDPVEEQTVLLGSSMFDLEALFRCVSQMRAQRMWGRELAIFPPAGEEEQWLTPHELVRAAVRSGEAMQAQAALLEKLDEIAKAPENAEKPLEEMREGIVGLATERGEYGKTELEVAYYRSGLFHWSLGLFAIGLVLVSLSWLVPRNRWLYGGANLVLVAATVAAAVLITLRCIIQSRPPVTTLYETILFVTATGAVTALVTEWMTRRRIALSLGAIVGLAGMFLAMKYEAFDGRDTMPSLMAVLDTNFWLATHVTTVTLGYSAGLLACFLAHVHVIGKSFTPWRDERTWRPIARMVYGIICFGLIFSVIGTILGGIWANESWGRFWGWDPKENGALMIVLWELAMLHARKGGYIKDFGFSMAAIFGGIVVAFSWWGVNQLAVGLHSYGFTSGIQRILFIYYGLELLVLVTAGVAWWANRAARRTAAREEMRAAESGAD